MKKYHVSGLWFDTTWDSCSAKPKQPRCQHPCQTLTQIHGVTWCPIPRKEKMIYILCCQARLLKSKTIRTEKCFAICFDAFLKLTIGSMTCTAHRSETKIPLQRRSQPTSLKARLNKIPDFGVAATPAQQNYDHAKTLPIRAASPQPYKTHPHPQHFGSHQLPTGSGLLKTQTN